VRSQSTVQRLLRRQILKNTRYNGYSDPILQVKRYIFLQRNVKYNNGFGSPVRDVCSQCIELIEKIKSEKDNNKKQDLIIAKRVQLGTRNFGHHFSVTSKHCNVNHSLLST
jgi:hypothetical protein